MENLSLHSIDLDLLFGNCFYRPDIVKKKNKARVWSFFFHLMLNMARSESANFKSFVVNFSPLYCVSGHKNSD